MILEIGVWVSSGEERDSRTTGSGNQNRIVHSIDKNAVYRWFKESKGKRRTFGPIEECLVIGKKEIGVLPLLWSEYSVDWTQNGEKIIWQNVP